MVDEEQAESSSASKIDCAEYAMNASPSDSSTSQPDFSVFLDQFSDVPYTPLPEQEILDLSPPPSFSKLFSILYTLYLREEISSRAFLLTSHAIKENPSNPTAWIYRRKLVEAQVKQVETDVKENARQEENRIWERELAFTASVFKTSRKNYQAWQHRRFCIQQTQAYFIELEYIDVVLSDDPKNYHAWSHRIWLCTQLKQFNYFQEQPNLISKQYESIDWFIRTDVRNNSAWNFRSFLLLKLNLTTATVSLQSEIQNACDMVALAPRNESVWNYLQALSRQPQVDISIAIQCANRCLSIDAGCIPARRFLIHVSPRETEEQVEKLKEHCEILANGIDPVRKKYWQSIREEISNASNPDP